MRRSSPFGPCADSTAAGRCAARPFRSSERGQEGVGARAGEGYNGQRLLSFLLSAAMRRRRLISYLLSSALQHRRSSNAAAHLVVLYLYVYSLLNIYSRARAADAGARPAEHSCSRLLYSARRDAHTRDHTTRYSHRAACQRVTSQLLDLTSHPHNQHMHTHTTRCCHTTHSAYALDADGHGRRVEVEA